MYFSKKNLVCFFLNGFILSCSNFNPISSSLDSTVDGNYVIETGMTDGELLEYGQIVLHRFKTVPHLVALKNADFQASPLFLMQNQPLYLLPSENTKKRQEIDTSPAVNDLSYSCLSAFCEAKFDALFSYLNIHQIELEPVKVAIIDSGIVPATFALEKSLSLSVNLSGDQNMHNWSSHGTYIASVLSGFTQSEDYLSDIYAPNALLTSVKINFVDDVSRGHKFYGSLQLAVALDEAVASGAQIVNLSFSYAHKPDPKAEIAEKIVMSRAREKGVVFVVAAGNDAQELNVHPVYPASYDLENIITVASHTVHLTKSNSSNYGTSVDLSAQGGALYANNKYGGVDLVGGTSFAAPLVVSAVSLYWGVFSQAHLATVIAHLLGSANPYYFSLENTQGKAVSRYGRLNTWEFLKKGFQMFGFGKNLRKCHFSHLTR
jgi:subtilisin family serine protease